MRFGTCDGGEKKVCEKKWGVRKEMGIGTPRGAMGQKDKSFPVRKKWPENHRNVYFAQ